ncbi:MAG: C2 domain-containing protein [Gemmataceae bacterium]
MKTARLVSCAVVAAVAALLLGSQVFSADDKDDQYTVIIKKVEVKKTKADGSSWDPMNGAPDLYVTVRNNTDKSGKTYSTKVKDDTFVAEFNEPTTVRFKKGEQLHFEVMDKDPVGSDEVGAINVNTGKISEGGIRLENFGQVVVLEVSFKKL